MRDIKIYTRCLADAIEIELNRKFSFGCVSYFHNGSHPDMDFETFLKSKDALVKSFEEISFTDIKNFKDLKKAGIYVERTMLEYTSGINTHKGLIFLNIFLIHAFVNDIKFNNLEKFIKDIAKDLILDYSNNKKLDLYRKNGLIDVRNIPLTGYRDILNCLPLIKNIDDTRLSLNIIARCDDTTTFNRSNKKTLDYIKLWARNILQIKDYMDFIEEVKSLDKFYINNNLSSGGAADIFTTIRTLELLKEKFYD